MNVIDRTTSLDYPTAHVIKDTLKQASERMHTMVKEHVNNNQLELSWAYNRQVPKLKLCKIGKDPHRANYPLRRAVKKLQQKIVWSALTSGLIALFFKYVLWGAFITSSSGNLDAVTKAVTAKASDDAFAATSLGLLAFAASLFVAHSMTQEKDVARSSSESANARDVVLDNLVRLVSFISSLGIWFLALISKATGASWWIEIVEAFFMAGCCASFGILTKESSITRNLARSESDIRETNLLEAKNAMDKEDCDSEWDEGKDLERQLFMKFVSVAPKGWWIGLPCCYFLLTFMLGFTTDSGVTWGKSSVLLFFSFAMFCAFFLWTCVSAESLTTQIAEGRRKFHPPRMGQFLAGTLLLIFLTFIIESIIEYSIYATFVYVSYVCLFILGQYVLNAKKRWLQRCLTLSIECRYLLTKKAHERDSGATLDQRETYSFEQLRRLGPGGTSPRAPA